MAFCENCGHQLVGRFCGSCGQPAGQSLPVAEPAGAAQVPAPPMTGPGEYPQPPTEQFQQVAAGYQQTAAGYQQAPAGYQQTAAGYQQTPAGYQQTAGQAWPPAAGRRRPKGAIITAIVLVLVLATAGTIVLLAKNSTDSVGASTPEKAAQQFFEALDKGDLLGAIATLDPAEMRALRALTDTTLAQAKRLDAVDNIDLGKVSAGTVKFTGLTYGNPVKVADDITIVPLMSGRVKYTWDLDKSGLAKRLLNYILLKVGDNESGKGSISVFDIDRVLPTSDSRGFSGLPLTTVRVDGKWHLSLLATAAEYARAGRGNLGEPLPKAQPPSGAETAEQAVKEFIVQATGGNPSKALSLVDPRESRLALRYLPALVEPRETSTDEVWLSEGTLRVTSTRTQSGQEAFTLIEFKAGKGRDWTRYIITEEGCFLSQQESIHNSCNEDSFASQYPELIRANEVARALDSLNALRHFVFFATYVPVEVDGKWYISASGTLAATLNAIGDPISPSDIRRYLRN